MRAASKDDELPPALPPCAVKVLGDGPDREKLEALAVQLERPRGFLGYGLRADGGVLCASDITVNSLVKSAAQSIASRKSATTLASGNSHDPTQAPSPEFRAKVTADGFWSERRSGRRAGAGQRHPSKLCRSRVAAQDHGLEGACRRRKGVRPTRAYREIVDLLRTLLRDFCQNDSPKRAERVKIGELAYADCVRSPGRTPFTGYQGAIVTEQKRISFSPPDITQAGSTGGRRAEKRLDNHRPEDEGVRGARSPSSHRPSARPRSRRPPQRSDTPCALSASARATR